MNDDTDYSDLLRKLFWIGLLLCGVTACRAIADDKPYQFEADESVPAPRVEPPKETKPNTPAAPLPKGGAGVISTKPAEVRKKILRFHHAVRDCTPCIAATKWVKRQKELKSLLVDPEIVDHATPIAAGDAGVPVMIPCFELVDTFGKHHWATFYMGEGDHPEGVCAGCLNDWVKWNGKPPGNVQFDKPADVRVAAAGAGGTVKAREQIGKAFEFIRTRVGENVPMSFNWSRTGGQQFPLLRDGDWSARNIFGDFGRIEVSAKGSKLPIDSIGFGYRIRGADVEIDADPILFEGATKYIDGRNGDLSRVGVGGSQPVGFIDPATAWTVFSVLRTVWGILRPQADLTLGGNVVAVATLRGQTLTVDFNGECPRVRLVILFTFHLGVKQVVITPDAATVFFTGSRWIKSRRFELN